MLKTPPRREEWNSELRLGNGGDDPGHAASPAHATMESASDLCGGTVAPENLTACLITEQMCLAEFPRNEMVATCQTCGKVQRYRTHRLIAEHGRKETISEVLALKSQDCECGLSGDCKLILMAEPA